MVVALEILDKNEAILVVALKNSIEVACLVVQLEILFRENMEEQKISKIRRNITTARKLRHKK